MDEFRSASTKLLWDVSSENLKIFNAAQRAALYAIDEAIFHEPAEALKIQLETLKISDEVITRLGGLKILEKKPTETDKMAFYKWAICTRYSALKEKIAA